jgi:hypothetical protein
MHSYGRTLGQEQQVNGIDCVRFNRCVDHLHVLIAIELFLRTHQQAEDRLNHVFNLLCEGLFLEKISAVFDDDRYRVN